jgi:hypothetical protein
MGSSYSTYISVKVCFIHRTYVQHATTAIYYASIIDKDIDDCFLLTQVLQEHRQQQASAEAEDSWDKCQHIFAHVKMILKV